MKEKSLAKLKEQVDNLNTVVVDLNTLLEYTDNIQIKPKECDRLQNIIIGLIDITQLKLDKLKISLNDLTE